MCVAGDSIAKSQEAPAGDSAKDSAKDAASKDTASEGAAAAKDAASKTASAAKGAASDGAKLASKAGKYLLNMHTISVFHGSPGSACHRHAFPYSMQYCLVSLSLDQLRSHMLQVTQSPRARRHLLVTLPRTLVQKVQQRPRRLPQKLQQPPRALPQMAENLQVKLVGIFSEQCCLP